MKNVKDFSQFEQAGINRATAKDSRAKKLERDRHEKAVSEVKRSKRS